MASKVVRISVIICGKPRLRMSPFNSARRREMNHLENSLPVLSVSGLASSDALLGGGGEPASNAA